jgi:glucose/arabinose dehydrogenase
MTWRHSILFSITSVVVVVSTLVAACGASASSGSAALPPAASVPSSSSAESAAITASASAAFDPQTLDLRVEQVVAGLDEPVYVTAAGDGSGRLFVVERAGRIRIVRNESLIAQPFLDIRPLVNSGFSEQGLLSVAFHPQYAENGHFYVDYTDASGATNVVRYTVSSNPDVADPNSAATLLTIPHPQAPNHNGGLLLFGPDGYLYGGWGDGGGAGNQFGNAQRLDTLLGKIVRIDVNTAFPYTIPPDNPFVGVAGARPEIFAYGLRNPWRFTFDCATGDLYIADVGQNRFEWVHFEPASSPGGVNYGWATMEGRHCYPSGDACVPPPGWPTPIAEYGHDLGCSITGGIPYRGSAYPHVARVYFFADFCSGRIWSLDRQADGGWRQTQVLDTSIQISSFGEDEQGEQFLTGLGSGGLYRLVFASTVAATPTQTNTPIVATTATNTPILAMTATQTNTPSIPASTSTPTVAVGCASGPGGRGFALHAGSAIMSWSCGTGQSGYVLARLGTFAALLPPNGVLASTATSYTDGFPLGLSCYVLFALAGSPATGIANSDGLCLLPNVRSATRAPAGFTIQLDEGSTAQLSWGPPTGEYDGYTLVVLGSSEAPIGLGPSVTSTTHATGGTARCYVLLVTSASALVGNSDVLCGIPGIARFV